MSEKEGVLKKHTDLRNKLAMRLEHISSVVINRYDMYLDRIKRSIAKLNERLSLDDSSFLKDFYKDYIFSSVSNVRYDGRKLLQGDFTQSSFEYVFDKYVKDEQIDPAIRNKLKEIGNKVSEYEKDPLIQRFNSALENYMTQSYNLDNYIDSFIEEIDGKLIKYFLEHE